MSDRLFILSDAADRITSPAFYLRLTVSSLSHDVHHVVRSRSRAVARSRILLRTSQNVKENCHAKHSHVTAASFRSSPRSWCWSRSRLPSAKHRSGHPAVSQGSRVPGMPVTSSDPARNRNRQARRRSPSRNGGFPVARRRSPFWRDLPEATSSALMPARSFSEWSPRPRPTTTASSGSRRCIEVQAGDRSFTTLDPRRVRTP